jgi:hypothetical protein
VVNVPERGFADPKTTLTKYIWEYLGNPIPAEIYSGGSLSVSTSSLTSFGWHFSINIVKIIIPQ